MLDRVAAKYNLGDRANLVVRPNAPANPQDEGELLLMVGPGTHVPENVLDGISSALIDLGADVDDCIGHPGLSSAHHWAGHAPVHEARRSDGRSREFVVLHPPTSR